MVWSSEKLNKSEAFREEYRIKRLSKVLKERMVAKGNSFYEDINEPILDNPR